MKIQYFSREVVKRRTDRQTDRQSINQSTDKHRVLHRGVMRITFDWNKPTWRPVKGLQLA